MKHLILVLVLTSLAGCASKRANSLPAKPACYDQSEDCLNAWYESGDETGDYGPVDAAAE